MAKNPDHGPIFIFSFLKQEEEEVIDPKYMSLKTLLHLTHMFQVVHFLTEMKVKIVSSTEKGFNSFWEIFQNLVIPFEPCK